MRSSKGASGPRTVCPFSIVCSVGLRGYLRYLCRQMEMQARTNRVRRTATKPEAVLERNGNFGESWNEKYHISAFQIAVFSLLRMIVDALEIQEKFTGDLWKFCNWHSPGVDLSPKSKAQLDDKVRAPHVAFCVTTRHLVDLSQHQDNRSCVGAQGRVCLVLSPFKPPRAGWFWINLIAISLGIPQINFHSPSSSFLSYKYGFRNGIRSSRLY